MVSGSDASPILQLAEQALDNVLALISLRFRMAGYAIEMQSIRSAETIDRLVERLE